MKRIFFNALLLLIFSGAFFSCSNVSNSISVTAVDPLIKVFRESNFEPTDAVANVARGEYATLQFVIRSSFPVKSLSVDIKAAKFGNSQLAESKYAFVGYANVDRGMQEPPKNNLISLTGYFPDPLIPEKEMDVESGQAQPVWITVRIPKDSEPGEYVGKVVFKGKVNGASFSVSKNYTIRVYPVIVNKPRLWVTNWHSLHYFRFLNGGKEVEQYSDQYWSHLKNIADVMGEYCQNVFIVSPLREIRFNKTGNEFKFDFTNFDKTVQLFHDAGVVGRIEGGHLAYGNQKQTRLNLHLPEIDSAGVILPTRYDLPLDNPNVRNFYNQFLPAFWSHLKEKGWDKMYMQHITDEPRKTVVESYIQISKYIKSLVPGIKILDAADRIELAGAVDIWVPILDNFAENLSFYQDRAKAGDEMWFYTCVWPQGDYLNRFIEFPLLKVRYLHWLNLRYNTVGYLHWGFNQWVGDRVQGDEIDFFESTTGGLRMSQPAGDDYIVYPYKGKVISSIRLEAMRDGLYDYELLKMYEEKDSAAALKMCSERVRDFFHYDLSIPAFRQARKMLLENLSK